MKAISSAAIVAIAAATLASAALVSAAPAQAETKKNVWRNDPSVRYVRSSTRLTVRRPFTDPGTETLPLDQHYHDYAFSPTYTPYPNQGGIVGFWRAPLPSPIDMPGSWSFGY